jgi:hypothetical protein
MRPTIASRRRFLQQCSAAGTALGFPTIIPSSAIGKDGTVAPSNRTTLALIGCGGRGTDVVKNFLNDERVQVIAAEEFFIVIAAKGARVDAAAVFELQAGFFFSRVSKADQFQFVISSRRPRRSRSGR